VLAVLAVVGGFAFSRGFGGLAFLIITGGAFAHILRFEVSEF
jgi:hypothetical protein